VPADVVYASADLGAGFLAGRAQRQIELEGETPDFVALTEEAQTGHGESCIRGSACEQRVSRGWGCRGAPEGARREGGRV